MSRSLTRPFLARGRASAAIASAAVLAALPAAAHAEGWIDGPSFEVPAHVLASDVASAPDGSALAVWCGMSSPAGQPQLAVQHARTDGTVDPAQTLGNCDRGAPSVATTPSGAAAVAWRKVDTANGAYSVVVTRFDADGQQLGDDTTVASGSAGTSFGPSVNVGVDRAGDATVAWASDINDGSGNTARVAHVNADGTPATQTPRPLGAGTDIDPLVAVAPGGVAFVAWLDASHDRVAAARLDADGTTAGAGTVATFGPAVILARHLRLVAGAAGAVATWGESRMDSSHPIVGKRLPTTGPIGNGPAVDTGGAEDDSFGYSTAIADDGTVSIGWTDWPPPSSDPAEAELTRSPLDESASTQLLSVPGGSLSDGYPLLASAPDGSLAAAWFTLDASWSSATFAIRHVAADGTLGSIVENGSAAISPDPGIITGLPIKLGRLSGGGALLSLDRVGDDPLATTYVLDARGPDVTVDLPATASAGQTVAMSATAADRAGVSATAWSLGDGTSASGASVAHAYAAPGTYAVMFTATDGAGNETVVTRTIDVVAPSPPGEPRMRDSENATPPVIRLPAKAGAALKVRKAVRRGTKVTVSGTITKAARGKVTVAYTVKIGRRPVTKKLGVAIVKGRWSTTFKLTGKLLRATGAKATITVSYIGSKAVKRATAKHAVAVAKPAKKKHAGG
ncbi:MAG TPA: PKD domain-containing protein [Conexibacter sp.]|jgi:hypothetical protein